MSARRRFMLQVAACTALPAALGAQAQAARLDERDPQAQTLGYVHDSAKADKKRFPRHDVAQKCSNCTLFQGKAGDAWAACPLFGTRAVAAAGWCNAWAKRN